MPLPNLVLPVALITCATFSIILAAISWARLIQLSLPLPLALPALNILFTVIFTAGAFSRRFLSQRSKRTLMSIFSSASTPALTALLTLSLVYAMPSDQQSCAANGQWLRLFESKDEIAVRDIQAKLHCCGYNSMRDRAWPFPSRNVNASTCEKTQGYYMACGALWRQEQQFAAVLSTIASFSNWLLVVIFICSMEKKKLIWAQVLAAKFSSHEERGVRRPPWMHRSERGDSEAAIRDDLQEPGQARINQEASSQTLLNADAEVFVPDRNART